MKRACVIRDGRCVATLVAILALAVPARPGFSADPVEEIRVARLDGLARSAIGVTRRDTRIPCLVSDDDRLHGDAAPPGAKTRILLVGGLDGDIGSVRSVLAALEWFQRDDGARQARSRFAFSAVPCVNVDGVARGERANDSGGNPARGYPPSGEAYHSPTDPESAYLWRWIGMHAPDLVVEVRRGESLAWRGADANPPAAQALAARLRPRGAGTLDADGLVQQLPTVAACETGTIPAIVATVPPGEVVEFVTSLTSAWTATSPGSSEARREIERRVSRSALELATELSRVYGHDLPTVMYIPALALVARLKLSELTGDRSHREDVERILAPYLTGPPNVPQDGSSIAGHLIFTELARASEGPLRRQALDVARRAADLGLGAQGQPLASMPYHLEMSDSVFMGGPILAEVGALTSDRRYFDACANHERFMRRLVIRSDGIYRHSPLDETAWGRGNGFPALGMALVLSALPTDHASHEELLAAFRSHLAALQPHQDYTGTWHQVIDHPESFREFTATAMITFAMIRGVRRGWLDELTYAPRIERGFTAVNSRVGRDGRLVDVCTGTGKMPSLRAYYDRAAILGADGRGGAMAILVATEMATWQAERGR